MKTHARTGGTIVKLLGMIVLLMAAGVIYMSSSSSSADAPPPKNVPAADKNPKPSSKPDSQSSTELRVGSWNIEWLGKPEDRSGAAKDIAQDPADLADCIIASKVAVLGVCEIATRSTGKPIRSREIEATLEAVTKKTGDKWDYVLFAGRAEGDQLTGVLWDTRLVTPETPDDRPWDQTKDSPWVVPIPKQRSSQGSYLWNRPPNAMKFSCGKNKTDFVVIVLHMKADYSGDFAAHRKEEASVLVAALPEVKKKFHDQDILLLGDTNCTAQHEPAIIAFEQAGFFDLNAAGKATHWRGGSMDRQLVPLDQPEFKEHKFEVMSDVYLKSRNIDPREYKRRYSDHYMIVTTIKVMPDDD